jgi:hypothetical protein
MNHLLIGAISANYTTNDIRRWVETSHWPDCSRMLLVYNYDTVDSGLLDYLNEHSVQVINPDFNFWGIDQRQFSVNTGMCDMQTSYDLVHNVRFLHIWSLLQHEVFDKVLITDVKDVYFNKNPFPQISESKITATSEEIIYDTHEWNKTHVHYNLGIIGISTLLDKPVYNVGVFGGPCNLVMDLCADIYLLSVGKPKVADQTSFNYLIQTKYKHLTKFTGLLDKLAVHLHVINEGAVKFDLTTIPEYTIVHQYDRLTNV